MHEATPVGTSFMSRLMDFETSEGAAAGGDAGGGSSFPAPAIPAAEPVLADDGSELDYDFDGGGEPDPDPEAAPEAPAWAGPSQDEWRQTQEVLGQFGQLMEYLQAEPAPEPPAPIDYSQVDTTDPEQLQQMIDQRAEALVNERLGPYQPILDAQAQSQGEQMVRSALDSLASEMGEFDRDQALLLSNSFLANGMSPQDAFRNAAAVRIADEQKIRAQAVEDYRKSLGNHEELPDEPAGGGGTAQPSEEFKFDPRDPDKYAKLAEWQARRREAARASG